MRSCFSVHLDTLKTSPLVRFYACLNVLFMPVFWHVTNVSVAESEGQLVPGLQDSPPPESVANVSTSLQRISVSMRVHNSCPNVTPRPTCYGERGALV